MSGPAAERPCRPWRVVLTGPEFTAETDYTNPAHAYGIACASLRDMGSPATSARVMHWEDGHWGHYETVHAEDLATDAVARSKEQ